MRKARDSAGFKVLVWTAFLICAFLGAWLGLRTLYALQYAGSASFRETGQYSWLLNLRARSVAETFVLREKLAWEDLTYTERQELQQQLEQLTESLLPENTGFRYRVLDRAGEEVASNLRENELLQPPVTYMDYLLGEYGVRFTAETAISEGAAPVYTIACSVAGQEEAAEDEFTRFAAWYDATMYRWTLRGGVASALLCAALVLLGLILWTAGHRTGQEGIVLTWQDRIFSEIYLALVGTATGCALTGGVLLAEYLYATTHTWGQEQPAWMALLTLGGAACWTLTALGAALLLRTFAVRCKARALARSTLLCRVLSWLWRSGLALVRALPFLWKETLAYFIFFFFSWFLSLTGRYGGGAIFLRLLLHAAAFCFLCWWGIGFHRVREGARAISSGDLDYQIDTRRMPWDLRRHGEDLNNISGGMACAVEQQMRSERFKAELITNVSHDLKTPLTSIINYVDLLKGTQQTDPRAVEYIEVLDRKSQRLKKLTEDLVEASKASTGVLHADREKIGVNQLLDQALGEWREKLEERRLTLVTTLPEGETWVYADGRHLWRVVDNLLSNCAKYALEGTRVYLELSRGHGQVELSVKNISREALNVPPERLLERFVRGEESRTTEGSGLGLSIARSLTELQGGTFALTVDGDLFKAVVTLPQAN